MTDYTGTTLDGKYRITNLLGRGGMGAVYQGQHVIIGKTVAVKFLHAEFAGNEEVVKRFYREAQAAAAIGHDNIIDVMDVGISLEQEPYLVMEFLEGESLSQMLERTGPLPVPAACGIVEPVLLALAAAHAKGIVHRDLKPENIFLVHRAGEAPRVKLIDFGISKVTQDAAGEKLTQTGSVMGTPAYMAPEQARGSTDLDHRADLYSMGVIFYEMLTGGLPFGGANFTEIIINILTTDPIPPAQVFSEFPAEAEEALMRSLTKDPAARYQNAAEMIDALKQLAGFESRVDNLTHFSAGITKPTFASGDLGMDTGSDTSRPVAADVLSQVAGGTPTDWAGTRPAKRKGKGVFIAIGAAALISVAGVIAAVLVLGKDAPPPVQAPLPQAVSPTPVPVPTAAPAKQAATVEIKVKGAPAGARLFYNGMLVTENPFRVGSGDAITPLKVEADGFEPLVISVVPSENREVEVTLTPTGAVDEGGKSSKSRSRSSRKRKSAASEPERGGSEPAVKIVEVPEEPKRKKKKKLVEGARGTKIQTSFE